MDQRKLVVILADISNYTRFMVENQTAAVHGQVVITGLIESILKEVDIPLTLQEIEGDAVFLYAAHPGSEDAWRTVVEQVSVKLERFFAAFMAQMAIATESTPCGCQICRNADQLGLKIIVHVGEALFHEIARRAQVSGADVILAHRLLKNGVPNDNYLLLTDAAYDAMGSHLSGSFERRTERYDGFGSIGVRVRPFDRERLAARDALYTLSDNDLAAAVGTYTKSVNPIVGLYVTFQQLRHPVRQFSVREKALMIWETFSWPIAFLFKYRRSIPREVIARGRRRASWVGRPEST